MSYSREEQEARALAYVGSLLLSVGIVIFGSAAFGCRQLLRTLRKRSAEAWQAASAQITSGNVTATHGRFVDYSIGNVGYAYSVEGAYYSGYLTLQFWGEQRAWTFVDSGQNLQVMIMYKPERPQTSVLRLRDIFPW
jgi:hypothetical protein